jgi:hypothetical protein
MLLLMLMEIVLTNPSDEEEEMREKRGNGVDLSDRDAETRHLLCIVDTVLGLTRFAAPGAVEP